MLYFFKQTLRKTNLRNIIPFLRNTTLLFDTFVNKLIKPMGIYTLWRYAQSRTWVDVISMQNVFTLLREK